MDAGDWIALGAAVVALGAGIFSAMSWHQARRSAAASERSAAAAERSAQAEERAVALAEQAELARDAPVFRFSTKGTGGAEAYVVATLKQGPPEIDVTTTGIWIKNERGEWIGTNFRTEPSRASPEGRHYAPVDLHSATTETEVKIRLSCTEVHAVPPRTWTREATVTFPEPDDGPLLY